MGLEDVTDEILQEAETEAEVIVEEAKAERDDILMEAEMEAEDIIEDAVAEAEEEAATKRQKELSAARMDAKKKRLKAREAVLEKAFDKFRDRIHDLDEDREQELLEAALERISEDEAIGTIRTRDANKELAEEYGEFAEADVRGAIIATADGARRFDLTFDELIEQTIERNRQDVGQTLFSE